MCNNYNDWKKWSDNNLFITDRKKISQMSCIYTYRAFDLFFHLKGKRRIIEKNNNIFV